MMSLNSLPTKGRITINNLKKKYRNFYFLTLTCNKHPQVHTVNDDIYNIILSRCGTKVKSCYELNSSGQLHIHSLNVSTKALYMKELLQQLKKDYPEYHLRIDKINNPDEINYVYSYLHKERTDVRPIYYRLAKFYQEQDRNKCPPENALDPYYSYTFINYHRLNLWEMADLGFEYNSSNGRFKYVDSHKPNFLD